MEPSLPNVNHGNIAFGSSSNTLNAGTAAPRRSDSGGHANAPPKIRRRNRLITSCLECRRRKLKCDKLHPCTNCTRFVRDCVFLAPALDAASQLKLNEIKEKMGSLERTLEDDVARQRRIDASNARKSQDVIGASAESSGDDDDDGPEDEKNLEATALAVHDAAYYEDAVEDDVLDLGVLIGKIRLTERVGGFVRPKFAQEMRFVLKERTELADYSVGSDVPRPGIKPEYDLAKPALDFITPSSSFFFAPEPQKSSFMVYLPSKNVADSLLNHYWIAVHPVARILHRPTFERQWALFWQQVHGGHEPLASLQALVMGLLLSTVISLSEQAISMQLGVEKIQLLRSFQQGAESALCRANFLRTTKIQTLQALVMYLVPMCRREVTRAHSALTGTAIRLAECMGLHRDGTQYGLSPVEVHVRRILWYQLCFLDIRTCEATGPRPQIRTDDFDTKFPLNVNDEDLESDNPPTTDSDQWTDMTCTLVRFECNEMQRYAWATRPKIEEKKITLTKALSKVKDFTAACDRKYLPMFDRPEPIARLGLLIYKIMSLRLYIMFLHRYVGRGKHMMPERLREILLTSCLQQCECAMLVETEAALRTWAWYLGAMQQYHSAILLISELYRNDVRYHEDRVWTCLDFVFEVPPHLPRKEKAKLILTDMAEKTEVYGALRRVRASQAIEKVMASVKDDYDVEPTEKATREKARQQQQQAPASTPSGSATVEPFAARQTYGGWQMNTDNATSQEPKIVVDQSVSPGSSSENTADVFRAREYSFGSGGSPGEMVDVDWNEWDNMFPVNGNYSEFGNLPDFGFSTLLPGPSTQYPTG